MASTAAVPELLLKKRKRSEAWAAAKAEAALEARKKARAQRREIFKRAEQYVNEYRQQEKDTIRLRREAKQKGGFYVEPEAKLAFVVRIRGLNKIHPKITKATLGLLKRVEPYIAWGYPNQKTVKELIYKRGFGKVNGNRIPLTDNKIVEQALGSKNILCVEDLIHEIYTSPGCGKVQRSGEVQHTAGSAVTCGFSSVLDVGSFDVSNSHVRFMTGAPFKLSSARGGIDKKRLHYVEGGQAGNREEKINNFIRRMN
eukprot:gene9823-9981_t